MEPPKVMRLKWPGETPEINDLDDQKSFRGENEKESEEKQITKHLRYTFHNTNIWIFLSGAFIILLILSLILVMKQKHK